MLLAGMLLPLALAGCQQDTEIKSYSVEQPQREKIRTLAAILPDAKKTYFVRLSGPEAAVSEQKTAFDTFVGSLRLQDKKEAPIAWTTPDGWDEQKGDGQMRIAGFRIGAGATRMEATLTKLDGPLGKAGEFNSLLANINRWRDQAEQPPLEEGDLAKLERRTVDKHEVIVADIKGLGFHRGPAKMVDPHAGGLGGIPMDHPGKPKVPFTFDPPDDWAAMDRLPQFAALGYEVIKDRKRAEITMTSAAGDLVENVNRWRAQIGLPKATPAQVERDVKSIKVAGHPASYVDLANPGSKMPKNHILGVIVETGQQTWFIKMTGPTELVSGQKVNFEAFLKSFKNAE
jgi:hypothetical protein